MLRPDMDKLSGEIEIDETVVGGPRPGRRGRGAAGKQIVVIAVEKPTGHVQYRALQFAVRAGPTSYQTLVCSRRGRADQERPRGPARRRRVGNRRT